MIQLHSLKHVQFIKQQDKLFKDQHAAGSGLPVSPRLFYCFRCSCVWQGYEEADGALRARVKALENDVARYKVFTFFSR
jgi:hypothetical protein